MGSKAVQIVNLDVEQLIKMLNEALAEEWLAYYQYWIGAKLIQGPMRGEVEGELLIHATEELGHAELVANRIIQLGGTPLIHPDLWKQYARCPYDAPEDPYIEVVLEQNLRGERCAIQRYSEIAKFTEGKDFATYQMAISILNDEIEHENDLEAFLADITALKNEIAKMRF